MKGLIIKDFLNIFKNYKVIVLMMVFYTALAALTDGSGSFINLLTLIFAMYFLNTFSYDEDAKWDTYALTMPLSRERIVLGKYLTMLFMALISFTVNSALLIFFNTLTKKNSLFEGIKVNAAAAAAVIFFYSIIIPVICKFGIVKARIYIIIIYMVPFFLGSLILNKIKETYPAPPEKLIVFIETLYKNIYVIVPLALIALLGISYFISIRIYRKKEF